MADALKVKIMTKVTGMRSEKSCKTFSSASKRLLIHLDRVNSRLSRRRAPPAGLSQNKRPHDDSKGPRFRGHHLKDPSNIYSQSDLKRPGPASWTKIELQGKLDPKFDYYTRDMVNPARSRPLSSFSKKKKKAAIVIDDDDDEPSQMSKTAGHGGSRGPETRGFLQNDRSKLAPMAWSDIELQGKRDPRFLYVGLLARSDPPRY